MPRAPAARAGRTDRPTQATRRRPGGGGGRTIAPGARSGSSSAGHASPLVRSPAPVTIFTLWFENFPNNLPALFVSAGVAHRHDRDHCQGRLSRPRAGRAGRSGSPARTASGSSGSCSSCWAVVFGVGLQLVPHEGANSPYGGLGLIALFSRLLHLDGLHLERHRRVAGRRRVRRACARSRPPLTATCGPFQARDVAVAGLRAGWRLDLDQPLDLEAGLPQQADPFAMRQVELDGVLALPGRRGASRSTGASASRRGQISLSGTQS